MICCNFGTPHHIPCHTVSHHPGEGSLGNIHEREWSTLCYEGFPSWGSTFAANPLWLLITDLTAPCMHMDAVIGHLVWTLRHTSEDLRERLRVMEAVCPGLLKTRMLECTSIFIHAQLQHFLSMANKFYSKGLKTQTNWENTAAVSLFSS